VIKLKHSQTNKSRALIGLSLMVLIVGVGLLAYDQAKKPRTINQIMSLVKKRVATSYEHIAINDSPWVAQMGSGTPLSAPGLNFSVSSQSMPSLYFSQKADSMPGATTPDKVISDVDSVMREAGYQKTDDPAVCILQKGYG